MNLKFIKDNAKGYFTISPSIVNTNTEGTTLDADYWILPSEAALKKDSSINITGEMVQKDLEFLNLHLNSAYKTLSYLDLYNITDSVEDEASLNSKLNALLPNSAIVINATEINTSDNSYKRGDVILKLNNGTYRTIRAQSSGYYYPSSIKSDGNTFILSYSYISGSAPASGSKELTEDSPLKEPYEIIKIPLANDANDNRMCYSLFQSTNQESSITFPAVKTKNDVVVQPIVKFFLKQEDGGYEELICSYSIHNENNTDFIVSDFPNTLTNLYILIK